MLTHTDWTDKDAKGTLKGTPKTLNPGTDSAPCAPVVHLQVGFHPLGPAALALRMITTLFWLKSEQQISILVRLGAALGIWLLMCLLQPLLGYSLKCVAHLYIGWCHAQSGGRPVVRVIHHKEAKQTSTAVLQQRQKAE